jgi:hypothetical protein
MSERNLSSDQLEPVVVIHRREWVLNGGGGGNTWLGLRSKDIS